MTHSEPDAARGARGGRRCRSCGAPLHQTFVDLGVSPVSNALIAPDRLDAMEPFYPLHAYVCGSCFLVQLDAFHDPGQIFAPDYAYFSSYSSSWLEHAHRYVDDVAARLGLTPDDLFVEVASNDGYLLQYALQRHIRVLGIEPAHNVADAARRKGIPTLERFFGVETARAVRAEHGPAALIAANNVLAHVPDLNDFVAGFAELLAPDGTATIEFPHLLQLMTLAQFDTIYHEHFSYFSLGAALRLFQAHGMCVVDVEELTTHGGSLRIFVQRGRRPAAPAVARVLAAEHAAGLNRLETYGGFTPAVNRIKRDLLRFLIAAREDGRRVVAYGAAAKGSTLLNYCGVRTDLIEYVAELSERKQGNYLPGVRIPIVSPARIEQDRPDVVLLLAWNLRDEIVEQLRYIRSWGGRFAVPLPRLETF